MYEKRKSIFSQVPKALYKNRYCNQESFSVLNCGGEDIKGKITNEVLELGAPSFKVNTFPSTVNLNFYFYLSTVKSDVIAVGDEIKLGVNLDKPAVFVEVYFGTRVTISTIR